ncbi:hypothetical protein KIH07_16900 [Hydrogenophaga taeniospiralis]|uniref:hypothetical protein n=1 Tax=Hydrogenophaga taeniospiralis TaxID=65656 RepID=UPI001CF999B8|nr:hypothetical protein [Hydrogenophaga taeniospiralis]MCB4365424.1 hypothetical protein [Hydrogenophaga taeniospiralis]
MVDFRDYRDRLNWAMKEVGTTAQRLADHMGVSYQAVKKVMDGKTKAFSAANNDVAAAFLGITSRWLATGKGPIKAADAIDVEASFTPRERSPAAGVSDIKPPDIRPAFLHEDAWIAEAIRTLQSLSDQDRRAAVLNLRVFVATLDKPGDGQALSVAA